MGISLRNTRFAGDFTNIICFPFCSLIGRTQSKILADPVEAMLVEPKWPYHLFYNTFQEMSCDRAYLVDPCKTAKT